MLKRAWQLRNLGAFPERGGDHPSGRNDNPEAEDHETEVDLAMLELYDAIKTGKKHGEK